MTGQGRHHIPLHRLWMAALIQSKLTPQEQTHTNGCEQCRLAFGVCLKADSFATVLKELHRDE
jgi:hypothetical protein